MATINPVEIVPVQTVGSTSITLAMPFGVKVYQWVGFTNFDALTALEVAAFDKLFIQVEGTFAGGTVKMLGSLYPFGQTPLFEDLHNDQGNSIPVAALTVPGILRIFEQCSLMKPLASGGGPFTVTAFCKTAR